jgi:hypothetical protein
VNVSVAERKLFVSAPAPNFKKITALAPAPELAIALELPVITDFILKCTFFKSFIKEYRPNSHARSYSIPYEFLFLFTVLADPVLEPKLRYSGSGQNSAPCGSSSTTPVKVGTNRYY